MPLSRHELRDLLLTDLTADRARDLLRPIGFTDIAAASARLLRIAGGDAGRTLLADSLPVLLVAVSESPRPDTVLVNFERFVQSVADRAELFRYFRDFPRSVEILVRLFAGSQFLTEIMLCNPAYLQVLTHQRRLADLKTVPQLLFEADAELSGVSDPDEQIVGLRRFQRWELLRIGVCDFFGLLDLRRVTVQLSQLADCLVQACLAIVTGRPVSEAAAEVPTTGFSVLAMGKLGGEELNYSSDIDLIFLSSNSDPDQVRLAQRLIKALTTATANGFLYRTDLRLRPWGSAGPLVTPVETHLDYVRRNARLWEHQALLKARCIAGDPALAEVFLSRIQQSLFNHQPEEVRESVRRTKQRIEEELLRDGKAWGEVKLGQGSIRDVEFVVQCLQLLTGGREPAVRSSNTLNALVRLTDCGILQADEYRLLTDGYCFLRTVEHALQLMHNKQTHELPRDAEELSFLARRLDFSSDQQFLSHYRQHCQAIRGVYDRYLGGASSAPNVDPVRPSESCSPNTGTAQQPIHVLKHIQRLDPGYAQTFNTSEIERHAELAEQLCESQLAVIDARLLANGDWRVTIVAYDYLGELSLICGLMAAYGFNILDGRVFTYSSRTRGNQPAAAGENADPSASGILRRAAQVGPNGPPGTGSQNTASQGSGRSRDHAVKIVDVFTVRSARGEASDDVWMFYASDLEGLLRLLDEGRGDSAQRRLVTRVAAALRDFPDAENPNLYPIPIQIDNSTCDAYTVMRVVVQDTVGFLYELTNALSLNGVYIARLDVESAEDQIVDTLYVTDRHGRKITDPRKQWELQAATGLIKHFTHLLPRSPNPESALINFQDFLRNLFQRPDWPQEIISLEQTDVLVALARLLGVSDFLWTDFLRMQHANLFPVVRDVAALADARTLPQLEADLKECLDAAFDADSRRDALNAFKDREMFRADMRYILGRVSSFEQFSSELTDLAEAVVPAAVRLVLAELRVVYGEPLLSSGEPCPYAVCALGKFGGRELGFASDIEMMFLYAGEGRTTGTHPLPTSEFFGKLVEGVTHAIRAHREGIFEIDLRLRPYGKAGTLAVSAEAFRSYFAADGPAWPYERQALVKLRPICGDLDFASNIVHLRDALLYTTEPFDVAAMRGMRERQIRQLVSGGSFNAKLSPGGLVDIEYLVQGLQITHGFRSPALRNTNTLAALLALAEHGKVSAEQYERLRAAYLFERRLITAMRIVRGHARDLAVPPVDSDECSFLARRLGYDDNVAELMLDIRQYSEQVREIGEELLS